LTTMSLFSDHVALLHEFLNRRTEAVERIEALLSAQREGGAPSIKRLLLPPAANPRHREEREHFQKQLDACFFRMTGAPADAARLEGALSTKRVEDGLQPLAGPNGDCDPLELIARGIVHWDNTRWPGRAGRSTYAQIIYSVFMLQQLEHLWLRA